MLADLDWPRWACAAWLARQFTLSYWLLAGEVATHSTVGGGYPCRACVGWLHYCRRRSPRVKKRGSLRGSPWDRYRGEATTRGALGPALFCVAVGSGDG